MGQVTYRDGVAILQLIVYVPCLALALMLNFRHGFAKSSGWFFLITFALIRIAGAICRCISIDDDSRGPLIGAIVCTSIGLSPLTLVCLGLLARVNDFTSRHVIPPLVFRIVGLVSIIGLVLGIVGGDLSSGSNDPFIVNPESKTAIILFTVVFIAVVGIFLSLLPHTSTIERGERRILLAVGISCPFIAVRIAYALISDFADNSNFNSSFGNVTIYLCMAVLEEITVTIVCIVVGFTLRARPRGEVVAPGNAGEEAGGAAVVGDKYQGGQVDSGAAPTQGRLQQRQPRRTIRRRGPITWLIGSAVDFFQNRKDQGAQ